MKPILKKYLNRCYFLGHDWRYNFPISSMPNKAICSRCFSKAKLNLRSLDWEPIPQFDGDSRTDKQLVDDWF